MFYCVAKFLCWLPLTILHPTKVIGRKNLPKNRVIVTCNHRSNWDSVLLLLHLRGRFKILAKKELFKNKCNGAILRYLGAFPIDRETNDIAAIKNCFKILKDGKRLVIFPEGTRLRDDAQILGEIKSGLAMIAIKTKTPIVPLWFDQKPKVFRKSVMRIGEPFELSQFYDQKLDEQTLEKASQIVREKLLELREQGIKNGKKRKAKAQKTDASK